MACVGGLVAWVLAGILIYQKIRQAEKDRGTITKNVVVSTQPSVPAPPPSIAMFPILPRRPIMYSNSAELAPLLPHGDGLQVQ